MSLWPTWTHESHERRSSLRVSDAFNYRIRIEPQTQPTRQWVVSRSLVTGAVIVAIVVAVALLADMIAPYDIAKMNPTARMQAPSLDHPFGTDVFGRDLFSRVVVGARLSLEVALLAVGIAALPGVLLGTVSGLYSGLPTGVLSFVMDAWMAVPGLLLVIALTAALGRSTLVLAVALGLAGIPTYYRLARAESLRVSQSLFIEAARSLGAKDRHVVLCHVLPNVLPTLLVLITLRTGSMLMAVSAFSFIGLGAQPPEPEWGALLAESRDYMQQAWWLMAFPGIAIAVTVFGLNTLGDGLRDLLDPKKGTKS